MDTKTSLCIKQTKYKKCVWIISKCKTDGGGGGCGTAAAARRGWMVEIMTVV